MTFSRARAFGSIFLLYFGKNTYRCVSAQTCRVNRPDPCWFRTMQQGDCSITESSYDFTALGFDIQSRNSSLQFSDYKLDARNNHPTLWICPPPRKQVPCCTVPFCPHPVHLLEIFSLQLTGDVYLLLPSSRPSLYELVLFVPDWTAYI